MQKKDVLTTCDCHNSFRRTWRRNRMGLVLVCMLLLKSNINRVVYELKITMTHLQWIYKIARRSSVVVVGYKDTLNILEISI